MAKIRKRHEFVGEAKHAVEANAHGAPVKDVHWQAQELEAESETHLEDDVGSGKAVIIRMFEFGMNLEAFQRAQPTKQDIFNSHYKGIEIALWKDGMKVMPDVNPRVVIDEKAHKYKIFVGAEPQRGHLLNQEHQAPKTLAQVAHGR